MERQIQMQNQMRERQMAMMVARSRDLFMWFGSFYTLALLGGVAGYVPCIACIYFFSDVFYEVYGLLVFNLMDVSPSC